MPGFGTQPNGLRCKPVHLDAVSAFTTRYVPLSWPSRTLRVKDVFNVFADLWFWWVLDAFRSICRSAKR